MRLWSGLRPGPHSGSLQGFVAGRNKDTPLTSTWRTSLNLWRCFFLVFDVFRERFFYSEKMLNDLWFLTQAKIPTDEWTTNSIFLRKLVSRNFWCQQFNSRSVAELTNDGNSDINKIKRFYCSIYARTDRETYFTQEWQDDPEKNNAMPLCQLRIHYMQSNVECPILLSYIIVISRRPYKYYSMRSIYTQLRV